MSSHNKKMIFLQKSPKSHQIKPNCVGVGVLLFSLVFFTSLHLFAQTESEIKSSDKFLWGEATGKTLEKAKSSAKRALYSFIHETITTITIHEQEELNEDFTDRWRSQTKSISRFELRGIRYLDRKSGKKFKVIAFISKSDYEKSLEQVAIEIRQIAKIAESKEQETNLAAVIKDYYLAYLKTFFSAETILYQSLQTEEKFESIRPFLRNKIESFLADCKVVSLEPEIDPRIPNQIVLPFKVGYANRNVNGLTLQLNIPNEPQYVVKNGAASLYLDIKPSSREKHYSLILSLNCDEKSYPDEIIELHKSFKIRNEKTLNINFSSVINIDFNVKVKNGLFSFKPIIENLSVSDLEWDFGDGTISKEDTPTHVYEKHNDHLVMLTLNQNKTLSISKKVSAKGDIVMIPNPRPTPEPTTNLNTDILNALLQIESFEALERQLIIYKKNNKLMYSVSKSDFIHPENCHVFIINTSTGKLVAVLDRGGTSRKDLLSGEMIYDIRQRFRSKGALWVEIY